jgi:hypothetical protein
MSKIILECQVDGISTKVDGTVTIKIGTQELDPTSASALFGFRNKHCKVLLSDSNITNVEAEIVDRTQIAGVKKNKTPSQRLRATLFVLHSQQQPDTDFEQWYNAELEKIIAHYKAKLD